MNCVKGCMSEKEGGLGIQNLLILNKALLGKWCWRFASKMEPLWKQVIIGKFEVEEGGRCSLEARDRELWKGIRKEMVKCFQK